MYSEEDIRKKNKDAILTALIMDLFKGALDKGEEDDCAGDPPECAPKPIRKSVRQTPTAEEKREADEYLFKTVGTREDYANFVTIMFDKLRDKIKTKSDDYSGKVDNVLEAPMDMASRASRSPTSMSVFSMLNTLKDKHEVTIMRQGMTALDVEDRLTDIILYTLLELYVLHNKDTIDKQLRVWYNVCNEKEN